MANLNYAKEYSQALAQAYPYMLNFGRLFTTENTGKYRVGNSAKTIEIPVISTTGRKESVRDTMATFSRNVDNSWETKTLSNQRYWDTLIHPKDIDQTNYVLSIKNITKVFNETQKFPEMDAYFISKIYSDYTSSPVSQSADTTALTTSNILERFDEYMKNMDEARVPQVGRLLYVTPKTKKLLKEAQNITRNIDVGNGNTQVNRIISRLDEVEIITVPSDLMKTAYNFTTGYAPASSAKQVNMFLVHPSVILYVSSYDFASLDEPSAKTAGKYLYFEESFEDAFILNQRAGAIQFNIEGASV